MNPKKAWVFFGLFLILLVAFWLRRDAFWLPHWKGDQSHYAVLAMKLDKQGFGGYNLREVRLGSQVISRQPPVELVFFKPGLAGDAGDIIRVLRMVGQPYYDEPLHFRAPLFSWFLMWSHRIFSGHEELYGVCSSNLGEQVRSVKPPMVLKTQFWAAAVPLFFNLAVIVMTFFLGWKFFDERVGLWAAFLMATNPLSLTLAYRLLAEDVLTFFVCVSVFLYLIYYRKKNILGMLAAGAAAGLAILAKQTGGLLLAVVWFYTFLRERKIKKSLGNFFNKNFLLYTAAAFLVSGFWFWKVYQTFGSPLHQPGSVSSSLQEDLTGWFYAVSHRLPPVFFFSAGVIFISPLLAAVFQSFRAFWRQCSDQNVPVGTETMLWLWILVFFFFITEPWHVLVLLADQEHRFFYMAYPALAVLAALGLNSVRARLARKIKNPWLPDVLIAAVLFLNAWWGIPQAMKVIFQNNMLF